MATSIWSEAEALTFYHMVLGKTEPGQAEFFCAAARKKYMTEEQKKTIKLGDTCMMGKNIIKDHDPDRFLAKLHQLDASLDWFEDLHGNYLPRSCICMYMNLNHSILPKVILDFKKELAECEFEYHMALLRNTSDMQAAEKLAGIHNRLLKAYQDPKNCTDDWIDIDMDMEKHQTSALEIQDFVSNLETVDGIPIAGIGPVIETQGGYHVLINKDTLSFINRRVSELYSGPEIKKHVLTARRISETLMTFCINQGSVVKEISVNQNRMVPIPGTIQNGFEVKMHIS